MLPETEIQQYGGKAAIINHIRDKLPHISIPNYVIRKHGSSLGSILPYFQKMHKPVIVRSSSPYEYNDFEGIFESVRNVYDENSLKKAIEKVEKSAISERAMEYARQNGFKIDSHIHMIIQEQSDSKCCGVMMRHPNNPDLIFINYFFTAGGYTYKEEEKNALFNENTQAIKDNSLFANNVPEDIVKKLVESYKQVESLTDIAEGYSLFVEFGLHPFALYQVRPFRKIEMAKFEISKMKDSESILNSDICFGITPPNGIVLPVLKGVGFSESVLIGSDFRNISKWSHLNSENFSLNVRLSNLYSLVFNYHENIPYKEESSKILKLHNLSLDKIIRKPYCFITSSATNELYDVDLSVPYMQGLVIGKMDNFLTHNLMRLLKKAKVSVLLSSLFENPFYKQMRSIEDKVRIISNGKEAVVIKE